MTSFFQIAILSIYKPCTEIEMIFLESWGQIDLGTRIFLFKNHILKIWPHMTRDQLDLDLHLVKLQNDLFFELCV